MKKLLHADILRRELFWKLAYFSDDIWFWAMAVLNGTKIILPPDAQRRLIYIDIDAQLGNETLSSKNIGAGKNDLQIRQVIKRYPTLLEKLIRETVTFKPYLSVVLPIKNFAYVQDFIRNIFAQNFPDFELIIINIGARSKIPVLPSNFQIINYTGGSLADALNLGLQKSAGEYILFMNANNILTSSLEMIAQFAKNFSADVIHFAGHFQIGDGKFVFDDTLRFNKTVPILFDTPRQNRAVIWLQNKLSRRLDTKIFRRESLVKREINFGDGISEFLFKALILAEKYLIVPQAFCLCRE